jgi:hypothetical protein
MLLDLWLTAVCFELGKLEQVRDCFMHAQFPHSYMQATAAHIIMSFL